MSTNGLIHYLPSIIPSSPMLFSTTMDEQTKKNDSRHALLPKICETLPGNMHISPRSYWMGRSASATRRFYYSLSWELTRIGMAYHWHSSSFRHLLRVVILQVDTISTL